MLPPEFSATNTAEHTLIANHYVETEKALNLSVAFVRGADSFAALPQMALAPQLHSLRCKWLVRIGKQF